MNKRIKFRGRRSNKAIKRQLKQDKETRISYRKKK